MKGILLENKSALSACGTVKLLPPQGTSPDVRCSPISPLRDPGLNNVTLGVKSSDYADLMRK